RLTVATRLAAASTSRCWVVDCRAIAMPSHSSPSVCPLRSRSRSSSSRRVGSARALNTASTATTLCRQIPAYQLCAVGYVRPVPGRILGPTRAGVWVLFVLAALNGVYLYFAPGEANEHYAWSIKLPVNAAFIGAGFLAGTLATGLVLTVATRWRSFST